MKKLLTLFPLLCLATACEPSGGSEWETSGTEGSTALTSTSQPLTCKTLSVSRGSIGAGQGTAALSSSELSGTQDVWTQYVEFSPNTSATCTYVLPTDTPASALAGARMNVNYRGPRLAQMPWYFDAWDVSAARWVTVADNGFAQDWLWTARAVTLPAPLSRFFDGSGTLKLRFRTASSADVAQLDLWTVTVDGATGGPDAGTSPDAGTTTDAGTPLPPPSSGIWRPTPGTTWQWQLSGTLDTSLNVAMYDIDLFDTAQADIDRLRGQGRKVICYFSAGSREDWRPDANQFPAGSYGNNLDGWAGERWLDTRNATVRQVMRARLDLARQKRCDGVEPDNVDAYANNSGFSLTRATQLDYNRFLATEAHARGLSIGLKNAVDLVADLEPSFDWALNEECVQYNECGTLTSFIRANKAVFHTEYGGATSASGVCAVTKPLGFSTLIKRLELDAWRVTCP